MSKNTITDYAFYDVYDYTNSFSVSGYALSICPFTFVPRLKNNAYLDKVLWDFGDGTTSTSLCATHTYKFPGDYTVSLYVYTSAGDAYTSTFSRILKIKNFINDVITLSSKDSFYRKASEPGHPGGITVIAYNSLPTYQTLSGDQVTISFYASGSSDYFITSDQYYSDKYSHLRSNYYFYEKTSNPYTGIDEINVVDSWSFKPQETLYAHVSNNNILLCDENDVGAIPVGSRSLKQIYFISDDISKSSGKWLHEKTPTFGFLSFDTSKFDDGVSYNNDYYVNGLNRSRISYLNTEPTSLGIVTVPHLSVNNLTFSQNGLDGSGEYIENSFNIPPIQYTGTRIPFTIRIKSNNNYPVKYLPSLTAADTVDSPYKIKIVAVSGDGEKIPDSAAPYIFESKVSQLSSGAGFWKGYMYFDGDYLSDSNNSIENIRLSATSLISETYDYIDNLPTVAFIGTGSASDIIRTDLSIEHKNNISQTTSYTRPYNQFYFNVDGLSEFNDNAIAVIPDVNSDTGSNFSFWAPANDQPRVIKYDTFNNLLYSIELSSFNISVTSLTGSRIAVDGSNNIWLTLTETSSAIKINTDSIANNYTIAEPASSIGPIDIDSSNNLLACFSDSSGTSVINKYSSSGALLSSISLTSNYIPVDICITSNDSAWIIAQNTVSAESLSSYRDLVFYYDNETDSTSSVYEISGRGSYCTIDVDDNLYFIQNVSEVYSLSADNFNPTEIIISAPRNTVVSDLQGIATTAGNDILVIDNYRNKIVTITPQLSNSITSEFSISKTNTGLINAVGDWTGFKWVNKFSTGTATVSNTLTGESSNFSVYNENKYKVEKASEYFNASQLYNDLRYQEALSDYRIMFDEFIGSIVGNLSSVPDSLGKRLHDKISDFTNNITDIDKCNIRALYNLYSMVGAEISDFENFRFSLPSNLGRLLDIFSIKKSYLLPTRNKFDRDFNTRNHVIGNNIYGINLGERITDLETVVLSSYSPIVAKSKFSQSYTYINTNVLSSYINGYRESSKTYPLSSFSIDWGWPLVLQDGSTYRDLGTLYELYYYTLTAEGSQVDGVLNWENSEYQNLNESLSGVDDWYGENGIVAESLRYTILDGAGLFADTLSG